MVKIVVLASFNMDLVMRTARQPQPGETLQGEFAMYLGGKGFNQAVAARRLGTEVSVIGRVGDDEFGGRFLDALDREGIDRTSVSVDPLAGTGVASIIVDDTGENAIVQAPQANRNVSAGDVARAQSAFDGAAAAVLQLETSDEAAIAFARAARNAGARTVLNPAPAAPVASALLALADILVANELEAAALVSGTPGSAGDAPRMAGALHAMHGSTVIVTRSERGAVAIDAVTRQDFSAHSVQSIDTVGAGDAFCAAFAVATAEGAGLAESVRFANAAGALATTKHGAEPSMPRRDEVEALLRKGVTR
jgi:ribokinase